MKNKAGIVFVLLAVSITALISVSCGNDKTPQTCSESTGTSNATDVTSVAETEKPFHIEDQDYKGYEFSALLVGFGNFINDFEYSEEEATVMDNAIYKRNVDVEDKLGVSITYIYQKASGTKGSSQGLGSLMKSYRSGDASYDTAIIPAYDVAPASYSGFCYELNSVMQFDFTADYWDQNAVKSLTVQDMLFFTIGDFNIDAFDATECIAFNKEIAETYEILDLYTLVEEGKWTMDKWKEYTSLLGEDLDNDGFYTNNDFYGSVIWDDAIFAIINGSGEHCCYIDESGAIVDGMGTERVMSVIQEFIEFASINNCLRFQQNFGANGARSQNSSSTHLYDMFLNNQCLFVLTSMGQITEFRDMEIDYGILPYFKYDENQDSYHSTVSPYNTRFLCLPLNLADVDRTGTILETIAYYSNKYIADAYYEKTLVGKTIRDDESLPVLKLLRETRVYDIGYYYRPGDFTHLVIQSFRDFNANWASTYDKGINVVNKELETINANFNELVSIWQ